MRKPRLEKETIGRIEVILNERYGANLTITSKKEVASFWRQHQQLGNRSRENVLRDAAKVLGITVKEHNRDTAQRKAEWAKRKAQATSFFSSLAWRRVRYDVLKRDGGVCVLCKKNDSVLHVDHIKPRSIFPELSLDPDNLQTLCEDCNMGKGNNDATDWRAK